MPTYRVDLTRLAIVYRQVEVEAKDEEEAETKALAEGEEAGNDGGWEIDAIYDDGGPYCELSANEIEDVDE